LLKNPGRSKTICGAKGSTVSIAHWSVPKNKNHKLQNAFLHPLPAKKLCFSSQNPSHFETSGTPGKNHKSQTQNKNSTASPHHPVHSSCLNRKDMVRGTGYSRSEVDKLPNIIEDELPYSMDDWEHVH
jgi:hypothetical protein